MHCQWQRVHLGRNTPSSKKAAHAIKIDGLVAKLVNPQPTLADHVVVAPPATLPAAIPSYGQGNAEPYTETWKRQGKVAPGSWLPFPASLEPQEPAPLQDQMASPEGGATNEEPNYETEADRHYLESIRTVHRFGDSQDVHNAPQSLFAPSRLREAPLEHELLQRLLSTHEADNLLNTYRHMSHSYPFVIVPPGTSAHQLYQEKPMLLLAMMTAASSQDHTQQMALDVIFRRELAERTIISPRRTLGYHFVFSHKTQQIFFLHHLVIGLALDIGLHRDYQPLHFPHRPKPRPLDPRDQRERERAFLGCYYLSSTIGAGLQKPNLLKHAPYMTEWAQNLRDVREYDSDEAIYYLITLRRLDDQIQETLFSETTKDLPLSDTRTLMHVKFIQSQLDAWKRESQTAGAQRCKLVPFLTAVTGCSFLAVLTLSSSFTEMLLHNVALRPDANEKRPGGMDSTQMQSLVCAFEAGKRFLDALLAVPTDEYHLISFPEWMRLPTVIMTVAKMCMPSINNMTPGWDSKTAQDRVRLDVCLEALCYRMQSFSTFDKSKQTHPDFWHAMRFIHDLTRTWFLRKSKPFASAQPAPSTATGDAVASEQSGLALATPGSGHALSNPGVDVASMFEHPGSAIDDADPFAFLKDMDIDMEQVFDMSIWGDDMYNGMGFGDG
ncbi:hypothetical protein ACEQ8H_005119 [Pleosporales sp. CAS-2024a]